MKWTVNKCLFILVVVEIVVLKRYSYVLKGSELKHFIFFFFWLFRMMWKIKNIVDLGFSELIKWNKKETQTATSMNLIFDYCLNTSNIPYMPNSTLFRKAVVLLQNRIEYVASWMHECCLCNEVMWWSHGCIFFRISICKTWES